METNETLKKDISSRIDVLVEEQKQNDTNFEEIDEAITVGMNKINFIMQTVVVIAATWQLLKYVRNSPFLTETLKIFTKFSKEFYIKWLETIKEIVVSKNVPEEELYELIEKIEDVEEASNKLEAIKKANQKIRKEKT